MTRDWSQMSATIGGPQAVREETTVCSNISRLIKEWTNRPGCVIPFEKTRSKSHRNELKLSQNLISI
jgi:hypothetical protein